MIFCLPPLKHFQLVTALPDVFKQLTKSANVQQMTNPVKGGVSRSQMILERLAEAAGYLMDHAFPGFQELYAPMAPWVAKSCPPGQLTEQRVQGEQIMLY